ncbi:hypothetical protein ACA910_014116 [Epithemia clementina (nom. ined.)]
MKPHQTNLTAREKEQAPSLHGTGVLFSVSEAVSALSAAIAASLRFHGGSKTHKDKVDVVDGTCAPNCELYDLVLDLSWPRVERHLLHYPIDASYRDGDTWETPLYVACQYRPPVRIVRLLLEAYPTAVSQVSRRHGDLPLHIACRCQASLPILQELIAASPDTLQRRTKYGASILSALWEGRETVGRYANSSYHSNFWNKVDAILKAMARQRQGIAIGDKVSDLYVVHAAVSMGSQGCPPEILKFCLHQYADQVRLHDAQGCLPLHVALGGGTSKISENQILLNDSDNLSGTSKYQRRLRRQRRMYLKYRTVHGQSEYTILTRLLQVHPEAALAATEVEGDISCKIIRQLPLHMALLQGYSWKEGIEDLCRAAPSALADEDAATGFYPFQLAALNHGLTSEEDDSDLDTIFCLIRGNPAVVISATTTILEGSKSHLLIQNQIPTRSTNKIQFPTTNKIHFPKPPMEIGSQARVIFFFSASVATALSAGFFFCHRS